MFMKKPTLEEIIYESLLVSSLTGIQNEFGIDVYRIRLKAGARFKEIDEKGYSKYSEGEKW